MLAENEVKAFQLHQYNDFDIVISDVKIDQADGLNQINKITDINPDIVAIIISSCCHLSRSCKRKESGFAIFSISLFNFNN